MFDFAFLRWIAFGLVVAVLMSLDMFATGRRGGDLPLKRALLWVGVYAAAALLFCFGIYRMRGGTPALEFLTGYIIEQSLSVDNLFVFILIFAGFGVGRTQQPRVLKWGIIGAIAMRIVLIVAGVALLRVFHWVIYLFGAILVVTAVNMVLGREGEIKAEEHFIIKLSRRLFRVTAKDDGQRFFVREDGLLHCTPLFLVLVLIEFSDLVFAVDSIPAVLAVTRDPFIAVTSNIFAILGLRALYFLLAGVMGMFRFLKYGVAAILLFVGAKMLLTSVLPIPIGVSLAFICLALAAAVLLSVLVEKHV
jgi:tellurite resistance protein TerC